MSFNSTPATRINWGNTKDRLELSFDFNGDREVLRRVTNKRSFFQLLSDTELTPQFWLNQEDIPDEAFPIVCRRVLAGHSGDGIVIADNRDMLVDAPLYVQYIKKSAEFRIHVGRRFVGDDDHGNGDFYSYPIISEQRKVRRTGAEVNDWRVRNLRNGFVYQRSGIVVPECVRSAAIEAFRRSQLDFGAVDVIYNERQNRAYVLEINTAPGIEGTTVLAYSRFFQGE